MRRPNIIVCMCDQLRAFETGCYGNSVIRTPHIDRLAAEGVRIETAISSFPVCMAARSCLLSGQHNRTCTGGVSNIGFPLPTGRGHMPQYPFRGRPHVKDPSMAEVLRQAGYHTAAIGKWHVHSWPEDLGFDHYLIPRVNHMHANQLFIENGGREFSSPGFSVDYEAERVAQYLQQRKGNAAPFFLYYNISPPHCPLADAPEKYLKMYNPADMPVRKNVDLSKPLNEVDLLVYRWDYHYYMLDLPHTRKLPNPYGVRELLAEYYGLTTWVDDTVGRMLGVLDETDQARDTIVIFTSDHGDFLGSHGRVQKGDALEESSRIPLVMRYPGGFSGGRVVREQVMSLIDLFPTALGLSDLAVPSHIHGQNLANVLRGSQHAAANDAAIIETGHSVAIRTPQFMCQIPFEKGTRNLQAKPMALYDLARDPYQFQNLAGNEEFARVARRLEAKIREWDGRIPWMRSA